MTEVDDQHGQAPAHVRLSRDRRLLKHADFERVYRHGRRHFAAHMTVFALSRETGAGPRIGFTVSRALGGSVQRNRIRRRLREAVRSNLQKLRAAVDVVINPKKSAIDAEFLLLQTEVAAAFQKIESSAKQAARSAQESQS